MPVVVLLILLLICPPLMAVEVSDLYQATVPVASQSSEDRKQGVIAAFAEVLVKLTGDSSIVQRPDVTEAVNLAPRFVSVIGYLDLPGEQGEMPVTGLQVTFDTALVDQFIRRQQLPVWPSNRSRLLLWLVADDASRGRHFIHADSDSRLLQGLRASLQRRGVPFTLPSYDLQDQLGLSPDELWSLDRGKLQQASERYASEDWVALRFFATFNGELRGAWLQQIGDEARLSDASVGSEYELAVAAADRMADALGSAYAYIPEPNSSEFLVHINGVDNFTSHRQVLAVIEDLSPVVALRLVSVDGVEMTLAVAVEGNITLLREAVLRSGKFVLRDAPQQTGDRLLSEPVNTGSTEGLGAVESADSPLPIAVVPGLWLGWLPQ